MRKSSPNEERPTVRSAAQCAGYDTPSGPRVLLHAPDLASRKPGARTAMVCALVFSLILMAAPVMAQYQQQGMPMPGNVPPIQSQGPIAAPQYQPPPGSAVQPYAPVPQGSPDQQGVAAGSAPGGPAYPYAPHPNPYYSGTDPKAILSGTIDWMFSLPSVLMDRVSNFMDATVFPQAPATAGSGNSSPARTSVSVSPAGQPPAAGPLPAAEPYAPPAK
jgi:hypothetical protein